MQFRCLTCSEVTDLPIPPPYGQPVECSVRSCGGECERVHVCGAMGCEEEALHDEDVCLSHAIADVVRDPSLFRFALPATQMAIVRGMANRLRVTDLTRVQAPRAA